MPTVANAIDMPKGGTVAARTPKHPIVRALNYYSYWKNEHLNEAAAVERELRRSAVDSVDYLEEGIASAHEWDFGPRPEGFTDSQWAEFVRNARNQMIASCAETVVEVFQALRAEKREALS